MQLTKGAIGNLINRYKAVLKKCHLMNTFGSLAVAGMLIMGGAGVAAGAAGDVALEGEKTYDSTKTHTVNHLMGGWLVNTPETAGNAKGDITLTVNGGKISEIIGGSYAKNVNGNNVTVTHGDITTTISDKTTSAEFVVGGSKVAGGAGANLETGKTTLTITGGTFGTQKTDDYELVMGGNYAKTAGSNPLTATTEGSSVTVKGGTFHASVVGGSVAHNYSINGSIAVTDNGNTSVTITGGTFNPSKSDRDDANGGIDLSAAVIGGGLAYGANTSTVLGSKEAPANSSVSISGDKTAINGKVVAGSVVANKGGTAIVHGNTTLAMAGGTAHDDLIGGGMVENATKLPEGSTSNNLNITGDSFVTVTGGNALGEVIGGNYVKTSTARLENSAKVANSSVTIKGGTFADVDVSASKAQYIIGGSKTNASWGGTATTRVEGNSSVLIDGAVTIKDGALIGGSQAKAGNGADSKATAIVNGNSSVTVNNGTLAGVIGGGIAETYYGGGDATSEVKGTSSVTINGGKVTGNSIETGAVASNTRKLSAAVVGGGLANDKGSTATVGSTRVTIADGTINGKVVAGGAAANGGTTTVKGDTFLSMTDGTVKDDLVGGNLVDGSASTNTTFAQSSDVKGSTHVSLTGGNIDGEVVGGGYVRNANATANVEGDTYVTVSAKSGNNEPQAWVQYVIGGGKAMTNANGQVATAGVKGASHVLVEGDAAIGFGTVAGGGLARTQGNGGKTSANVSESNVEINGGTLAGVAGGGVAENYDNGTGTASALVTGANLMIINDGTINTVKYAAQESEEASVVGGGIAWSKGGSADADVKTANTVINGGSISRHVFAGGLADGAGATSQVDTANLTIRGGNLQGNIHAGGYAINGGNAEVSTATVTFDGTTDFAGKVIGQGHQDEQSFATVKDSTLAFSNYDGAFNGTVMAFDHISAAADSQVSMDVLDVTTAGHNNKLDINGAGTITAASVIVTNGTSLTVSDGGHLVAGDLNTQDTGSVMVEDLGSTLVVSNTNLDNLADKSLLSTAGSEIRLDGLADETSLADIKNKLAEDNTGIVNLGDTQITGLSELTQNGVISYEDWEQAGATGFTTDSIKGSTLTGVAGAKGSDDPEDTPPATRISGMAVSDVKLSSGTYLETGDSVTLTGLGNGSQFVSRADGSLGGAFVYGTLTLGDTAYTGTKYISYIGFGSDDKHTLNTLGADRDSSRIVVTSDIRGGEGKAGTINATDVTLQVSGNIGQDISAVPEKQDKLDINANDANILVGGSILAENVSLQNASLLHADKDLAIKGNLSGQGAVVADKTLTLQEAYTGKEGDDLTLQADTLKTGAINSTTGDLTIAATNLVTSGETKLVDDTLVADNVELGGALNASGESLVVVQDFGSFAPDGGFTPGALDNAVSVTGQSLMVYGAGAEQAQQAVAETGHTGAAYYAGKELKLVDGGGLTVGDTADGADAVAFGSGSLLVVDGTAMNGKTVFTGAEASPNLTASVDASSKLHVDNAIAGNFTVFDENFTKPTAGWAADNVTTDSAMLDASYNDTDSKVTVGVNDAHTVFPNLSDGMADAVNDLYNGKLNNVDSTDMGVRFLSRATNDHFLGADKDAAAATIESAARIAFAGAVPQMTKMASDAGSNAVVNRLGFANPADGAQAMDAEGKIVDRNTTGFALWIAPLWQSQHGWGMEAGNLDYGFNGNLGGVSLGADYTFENAIRAGITFNIGGGYAESSGGDLNSTENRMSFWGLGAYAGWNYENFGLMADVSYTSTWNDLKQDMDSRMGMGDLEADVQASAISAGLRAEYKLETSVLDVIPHIGVRYMSLNTWGFDAESNGGTVLEGDGFHQDIWTFPVGVTFTKDFTLDSGWSFKPSVDFSVIPAAGDIKAKQDVAFTGLPGSYEVETQMMDYLTWQGGVGLEMGNDTMSFGVNYTLQAGQHTTGHGVFGSFRYEF